MLTSISRGTNFEHAKGKWLTSPNKPLTPLKRIYLCLNIHVSKFLFKALKDTSLDLTA